MTRIGILLAGTVPATLAEAHAPYDGMMRRMLGGGYASRTYDVQAGELPAQPEDNAAYVITGSSAGVYDPLPWIAPLQRFLRVAKGRSKLVGVCFGHQVMAEAFGGRVEKSPKGWGLGLHRYDLVGRAAWMMEDDARAIAVAASHQDQVIAPPAGATVLGRSAFTPFGMLGYAGGDAMSVQFHPEFDRTFAEALVELRRPRLTEVAVAQALASFERPSDAPRVAAWIRRFVDGA